MALVDVEDYFAQKNFTDNSRIVYRHLEVSLTDEMLKSLQSFVDSEQGKNYFISAKQIVCKKGDEENGYFCSQLVAAAYKCMGLLPSSVSSASFWPGHFSSSNELHMCYDAFLAEEQVIDFNIDKSLFN